MLDIKFIRENADIVKADLKKRNDPEKLNWVDDLTAKDIVNLWSEENLILILKTYGEESWARKITEAIVERRKTKPFETSGDLANLIKKTIPRFGKIHPATKTFQALRIAVNDELNSIEKGLDDAIDMLNPGGRLCVISFHSLEDRIVKNRFRDWSKSCKCPSGIPLCVCNGKKRFKIITRKPVTPSKQEVTNNPQSRSAKLRAGERI